MNERMQLKPPAQQSQKQQDYKHRPFGATQRGGVMLELICYWDRPFRSWVLFVVDENGDQIGEAEYYPHREALAYAIKHF